MTRLTLPALLTATLLPLCAQAADPAGRWNTPWGEMRLHLNGQQVDGEYDFHGGRISGRMSGDELVGYWMQDGSEERCGRTVAGSAYWGRLRLRFQDDRFDGTWSYCDRTPDRGGWTGSRIAASTPQPAEEDPTTLVVGALAKALPPEAKSLLDDLLGTEGEVAGKAASPPPAVTLEMAMGELYPDWRFGIQHGQPKTLTGDLTCDGAADYFVGWTDLDNPDRQSYHIAVVYHDGGRLTHHHATLDLGGNGQYALCVPGPNVFPSVTLAGHPLTDADRAAYSLPAGCGGAVRLDDGMCDAIYIGWEPTTKQFILHRN